MPPARPSYASRRLRRTLAEWAGDVSGFPISGPAGTARVIWAEQNLPRPALPYIALTRRTSVSINTQTRAQSGVALVTSVQVTTTTPGEDVTIALNYGAPRYVVQVGDAIEDVRDGLIDAILARPDAVTAGVTGADTFDLAGLAPALAWPADAVRGCTTTPTTVDTVEVTETSRTTIVRVESFGLDEPDERALDYGDALIADLGRPQTSQFFLERGCGIAGPPPTIVDISGLSGAERETRAYFDLQLAQWTRHTTADPDVADSVTSPEISPIPADPIAAVAAGVSLQRAEAAL